MEQKKIGIVADNYKIERFKKELAAAGFTEIEFFTGANLTTITVTTDSANVEKVAQLCQRVEFHFKRGN